MSRETELLERWLQNVKEPDLLEELEANIERGILPDDRV